MKRIDPAQGDALQRVESGDERFLSRWSRLKRASRDTAPASPASDESALRSQESAVMPPAAGTGAAAAPAPSPAAAHDAAVAALPPVESLTIESDYAPFFQPKVPESLRRAAVKKLFADPHFNVMDGLDTYIDDYTKADPIPEAMLRSLNHAQGFFAPVEDPLEVHRREMAAEAEASLAKAMRDADAIPADDATAATESVALADGAATGVDAGAADAPVSIGTQRASDADPQPTTGTDSSPLAIIPAPATVSSERT
jgi:hypothetical protein